MTSAPSGIPRQSGSDHHPETFPSPFIPVWLRWLLLPGALVGAFLAGRWTMRDGLEPATPQPLARSGDGHAGHSLSPAPVPAPPSPTKRPTWYTCGMHPWVVLAVAGLCPVCHMELVPIDPDTFTGEIVIDPVVGQNIGVRVATVATGPVRRTIRTAGTVALAENAVHDVNLRVEGWIERVHVSTAGAPVRAGEPLLDLVSPALYAAQQEYLLALRDPVSAATGGAGGAAGPVPRGGAPLADAARQRLRFMGLDDDQIVQLGNEGAARFVVSLRSPGTGVVVAKNAFAGMFVQPGTLLYRIADLSTVWVLATVYEQDMLYLAEGQAAVVFVPTMPGITFEGRIAYVYPTVEPTTRQGTVRVELPNPAGQLRPGMFVTVSLQTSLPGERILVPRQAVIATGTRSVAIVSLGGGRFEPRQVRTGVETEEGLIEILEGLAGGEQVVVSAQFLLDSEARLREALAKMMTGEPAGRVAPSPGQRVESLTPAYAGALEAILRSALTIADALSRDAMTGVSEAARRLAGAADDLFHVLSATPPGAGPFPDHLRADVSADVRIVREQAGRLSEAVDLDGARLAFGELNRALDRVVSVTGVPATLNLRLERLRCPMYLEQYEGAVWFQPAGEVRNPYFGPFMLRCYDLRDAIPVTPVR